MREYKKTIIGIGFQIGVGKDTVADYICGEYGFAKLRWADALKEAVAAIYGWNRMDLEDQEFKATVDPFWDITPREALQKVGTEGMRNGVDPQIWIKALQRRIMQHPDTGVVIPDTRFLNEVAAVKEWGGYAVRVVRPHNEDDKSDEKAKAHPSETELLDFDGWDYVIKNTGTKSDLYHEVFQMFESIRQ
jgi:hypothetical protein